MKNSITYSFLFLFVLLLGNTIKAQQPYAIHLNAQNGLPSNFVYNLFQDSKGFVWLATNEGLTRYDGFEYVNYRSHDQTSVAGTCIKEDKYERIWYENFDGFLYYVENGKLKPLKQNTPSSFFTYCISENFLIVVQQQGIDVFDLKTLKLKRTISVPVEKIESIVTNGKSTYLVTDKKLYKIDPSLQISETDFFKDKSLKAKRIYTFHDDIYVVSKYNEDESIYFFDKNLNFERQLSIPDIEFIQGSDVIDNQIWIYTSKGVCVFDKSGKSIFEKKIFENQSISCVLKDFQENYWFATTFDGIYLVPELRNQLFVSSGYIPTKLIPSKKGFILGTNNGELLQLNNHLSDSGLLHKNSDNVPIYYLYHDSVGDKTIYSSNGFSFVSGSNYFKERHFTIALKEAVRIDDKYYGFVASGFFCLLVNPDAINTISVWDKVFTENYHPYIEGVAVLLDKVRGKSVDRHNEGKKVVCATNVGLYIISPDKKHELTLNNKPFYANKVIWSGSLIFALSTNGNLFKISKEKHFTQLNKQLGFDDFDVKRIKKIGNELIVVGSKHICLYNLDTEEIKQVDINISGYQIGDIWKQDNKLYIVNNAGIILVGTEKIRKQRKAALFHINHIMVNNQSVNLKRLNKLSYSENNIEIHFSVLDFGTIKTPHVYYRLNENKWIAVSNDTRSIQFASLSSGKYKLQFKLNGQVVQESIYFEIKAPFWQKWWFLMICFSIVSIIVYLYFKWQIGLMRNKIKLLNEKVLLEQSLSKSMLTAIKSQMNPHFFYNALNTIQAYIFTNDKKRANTYLAKFSKLTRTILEMSEQETVSLNEEIEALSLYLELEKMRFSENFEYHISTENISDINTIEFPPMIIQPYIENAVKHGLLHHTGEKKLTIQFEQKTQLLIVTIDDNGIGRKRSGELNRIKDHQSFATQANKKRLEILNKGINGNIAVNIIDKYDENEQASGTTVVLSIPI